MSFTRSTLAAALSRLLAWKPTDRGELELWSRAAADVFSALKESGSTLPDVPHVIWHFLSDADIRMKDPAYALEQEREVGRVIAGLESQEG